MCGGDESEKQRGVADHHVLVVRSREPAARWLVPLVVAQNSYFLQGCVGVHDGSVVWSRVRGRGYPARCVTSKCVRLDEFCNACHGRVETVLDCFQSRQSRTSGGKINEHFTRVSSRIEPAYLFNLRERAEFPRFREKIRVPFDYLPPRRSFVSFIS